MAEQSQPVETSREENAKVVREQQYIRTFQTIIDGFGKATTISDGRTSSVVLGVALVTLAAAISLKIGSVLEALLVFKDNPFPTSDLAILVLVSAFFVLVGVGLRVWDRHLADKVHERSARLAVEAAGQAAELITKAAPPPHSPPGAL